MPLGNYSVLREVAVPAEKIWGKGKDEDNRQVFRAGGKRRSGLK
jgi:hypothetical protein